MVGNEEGWVVCPLCTIEKGLLGSDLINKKCDFAFDSQEDFANHLELVHHKPVQRAGETAEQCMKRFNELIENAKKSDTVSEVPQEEGLAPQVQDGSDERMGQAEEEPEEPSSS
jgi:hypothetical protein